MKIQPFVLGSVHEIYSTILAETRVLNIYTPPGYKQKDTTRFPVIYLLDGSVDEDFIHISGLVQYLNFPWINRLEESIVVGIATVDRQRDFTYPTSILKDQKDVPTQGGSQRFISFLELELQPYIETIFRTDNSRTILGQSLGGLVATEILTTNPSLFNRYIIVSPSLWWDNGSLLQRASNLSTMAVSPNTTVYLAVGKEGTDMEMPVKELSRILKGKKNENFRTVFEYFPRETHATIYHRAVYNAFETLGR
jgi:predicted alpha/beta superfamily hydrolase